MRRINIRSFIGSKTAGNIVIVIGVIFLIYLLVSIYFTKHFFFNTVINGVDLSLKSHNEAENIIKDYVKDYNLMLIERNEEVEEIRGQDIGMKYNEENSISKIYNNKNSLKWIISLINNKEYYVDDLFLYDEGELENKINQLNCLNEEIIEPQNVSFKYSNGSYKAIEEVYGNKINEEVLNIAIKESILRGKRELDLDNHLCYENPSYTLTSHKTSETRDLLNKYVSTKIIYIFGSKNELLDGERINKWLSVDENLDVVIDEKAVNEYVRSLAKKYNTVGIARKIKTSTGKEIEVEGGFYGWRIDLEKEIEALIENIKNGDNLEKEPIYAQEAVSREENDIGDTYVEINITKQHLWFYKEGKLITHGSIVTGNPSRGFATPVGTYMLNYKETGSTLRGPGYEASVTYWMPFNGNIGIHDASWRYSFGGEIYKRNGSHGCVNSPKYLAKKIYENIEEGTPVICYEEEE